MSDKKISTLVVDDSAFMRKALKRMLRSDPVIRIAGDAKDGLEALEKVKRLKPDVVTLDVKMPGMDGIQTLKRIMQENPTPVIMISTMTSEGGETTLRALELGAVDFIDKSSCHTNMDILDIADSLVQKVKVVAGVDVEKVAEIKTAETTPAPRILPPPPAAVPDKGPSHLIAVGASTGGPVSLEKVLTVLPADYPGAILVVQHMPIGFTSSLAERMNHQCPMEVKEAQEDDTILPGRIYIAPGGYHLKLRLENNEHRVVLTKTPRDTAHCPSVDVMMRSVAENWQGPMMGIIMTGMGSDGVRGIQDMKQKGATIIAQDENTCVVFGMPRAAHLTGCVDRMVPLHRIAEEIYGFNR